MAIVDDQGRLFGRINIIDALAGALLIGLIPLIYGAVVLFRQPQPTLLAVTPTELTPQVERVRVTGRNLRPYLRMSFNEHQGRTFALIDAQTAEVEVPQLPPGRYDVILYDVAREVSRLPGVVTVEGPAMPPTTEARMLVAGRFVALDEPTAQALTVGTALGAVGGSRIEIVGRSRSVPDRRPFFFNDYLIEAPLLDGRLVDALVRTTCSVADRRCQVGGVDIEPGFSLPLFMSTGKPLRFVITDAVGDGETRLVTLRGRFVVPAAAAELVAAGHRARRDPLLGDRVPSITAVSTRRQPAALSLRVPGFPASGEWALEMSDAAAVMDVSLRLRAEVTREGLQYLGRPLKAGAPFVFEHDRYVLRGLLLAVEPVGGIAP